MCYTCNEELVPCDLENGTTENLIVGGDDSSYCDGRAFVDSLVSPRKCECDGSCGQQRLKVVAYYLVVFQKKGPGDVS